VRLSSSSRSRSRSSSSSTVPINVLHLLLLQQRSGAAFTTPASALALTSEMSTSSRQQ
jgi:hypothetical protein